ncbi:hypothetical protein EP331_11945 [bacterium]|nr:MAG: hypothetical protein EP331_11945 [bacterium]
MKGTLDDGPNRLNGGFWLSTAWPEYPVSYYLEFTEPVYKWSSFGSEAAIQVQSQFRTGFEAHELKFKKRFQDGFLENEFTEHELSLGYHNFYTSDYAVIKTQITSKALGVGSYRYRNVHAGSVNEALLRAGYQEQEFFQFIFKNEKAFTVSKWLSFKNKNRAVLQSKKTPTYLQEFTAISSYYDQLSNPFARARGTVSPGFVTDFPLYEAAHAGSRADIKYELNQLADNKLRTSVFIFSTNVDAIVESPLTTGFSKIKFLGDVMELKHYVFFDASTASQELLYVVYDINSIFSLGSGFGLSLSLKKQQDNPFLKAFSVKYDVPVWRFGNPDSINGVSFRHILSLSGTITF